MNNLVMRVLKYDAELTPIHVEGDKYVFKYENNIVAAVVIDDDMMLMYTSSKYEDYVVEILNPLKNIVLFVNMKRKVHIECKYNGINTTVKKNTKSKKLQTKNIKKKSKTQ